MVSVRGTDTICTIQKINHLLYWLERTDTKNQFSKIKKTSFCRRPDPRRGSGGGRRRPRPDPKEGGGGARPRGRRGGEGGRRWALLGLVVTEVGKEGVGGRPSWLWSPRWGRRALVGAARGHPYHRWGQSCTPPTASASPCRRRPPPPRHATASALPSPATAMPPPTAQIVASPKPEKREKREDRMRGEKRERTQREDKKGEDPRAEIFFGLARAPVGFDFLAARRARALISVV
jgi:hypothetical protein